MKKLLFTLTLFFAMTAFCGDVGIIKRMKFELKGDKLLAAEVNEKSPALVRMIEVRRIADGWQYELDFIGLEPGSYNVIDYLRTITNEVPSGYKVVNVEIGTQLEDSFKGELVTMESEAAGDGLWYSRMNIMLLVSWVIILATIIFARRKKDEEQVEAAPEKPSTAARLLAVLAGPDASSKENWQKIEGLLITHFCEKLSLGEGSMHEKFMQLKADSAAGPLIRSMETYLHAPDGSERVRMEDLKLQINQCVGGAK